VFVISYPLIPWFAVMALGFCFGPVFSLDPPRRRQWMIRTGLIVTAAFVIVRIVNVYGDFQPWTGGILSFLRCSKYPPSLDFLLMTLGPSLLLLAFFDTLQFSPINPLIVYGRAPLFYFIAHLYIIHLLAIPLAWIETGKLMLVNPIVGVFPPGFGFGLPGVYLIWIAVVLLLYPMCRWFISGTTRTSSPARSPQASWRNPGTPAPNPSGYR
jgi:hypothetical protein